jgi:hypothetical protein
LFDAGLNNVLLQDWWEALPEQSRNAGTTWASFIFLVLFINKFLPVEVSGAGVGEGIFELGDVRGKPAQLERVEPGPVANESQATQDGWFRTLVLTGDSRGAEFLDAVLSENRQESRRLNRLFRIKILDYGKDTLGQVQIGLFGLWRKADEYFGGRASGLKRAFRFQKYVGIQGKEGGPVILKYGLGGRVQKIGGRREEQKGLAQLRCEFGHNAAECRIPNLNRENGGHGVGRPGTKLERAGDTKLGVAPTEAKCLAQGLTELEEVHFVGCNLRGGKGDVRTGRRNASAYSQGAGAIVTREHRVFAAATMRAGVVPDFPGTKLKAESVEGGEPVAKHLTPDRFNGHETRDGFQSEPGGVHVSVGVEGGRLKRNCGVARRIFVN